MKHTGSGMQEKPV